MAQLNYHHLHYFHAIAQAGGLTKAAEMLNVSPSALSVQLQQLEHQLGHALFERRGRQLVLTEAGHVAFERAEKIFETGRELVDALSGASLQRQKLVRVGALSTLSRNFQIEFLRPLMGLADTQIQLRSGALRDLMHAMEDHQLDIVLTNTLPARDAQSGWTPHIISDQTLSLIGERAPRTRSKPLNELLATKPLILPTAETHMRAEFDAYVVRKGIKPLIAAEVDDMAMLRLMAREGAGFAVAPPIVLRDELNEGLLHDYGALGDLREVFYAITPVRRFSHLLVASLLPGADKSSKQTRTRD